MSVSSGKHTIPEFGWRDLGAEIFPHPPVIRNSKDGTLLVLVPDGVFLAGKERFPVRLPAYYLAMHCVTNAQYKRFVKATGHRTPENDQFGQTRVWYNGEFDRKMANHPVVNVSWSDALAYCTWAELRLPRELEWEKAARGIDGREYPWGNIWDERKCNCFKKTGHRKSTADVWSYAQDVSPWGVYQLSGNVFEWCDDWYGTDAYNQYKTGDLAPPVTGERRVLRGGPYSLGHPDYFRCTRLDEQGGCHPDYISDSSGFRCARSI